MSKIKELEKKIEEAFKKCGYDAEIELCQSNRPDLGEYQINDAMKLAKKYKRNPIQIANEVVEELKKNEDLTNINIAGAGFINISLSNSFLSAFINQIKNNIERNIDKKDAKKIILDYGGANVAKALHVGHLRSANIGEALNRLAKLLGNETISDAHLGDSGLQTGIVVMEIKERYPNLICFDEDYNGEEFDLPITKEDLKEIYPTGSKKIKEDEELHEQARKITYEIQKGTIGYRKLWDKVKESSVKDIKEIYDLLDTKFDLYEGEMDSFEYIPETLSILEKQGLLYTSEGAKVMDIKENTDTKEMPPILLEKNDGAYLYATTDLATIYSRVKKFKPDEIWYTTDLRQELHFEQVFRAAKKSHIADNVNLGFYGFGTMNGSDGKPFKTRNGGVMGLEDLINMIKEECLKRINTNIVEENKKEETATTIAIAALKYADLLPFRETDYIFDLNKFTDLDGKTGPYLLYSTIRIKSLLNKVEKLKVQNKFTEINGKSDKDVILILLNMPEVLDKAYNTKSLNEVAEYIYKLTSAYNKFYAENKILTEENENLKSSWIILSKVVYDTNMLLLNLMGIKCPEKM